MAELSYFFTNEEYAEKIIQNGLIVQNTNVSALPVTVRPTRVLVSNLTPNIPDAVITDFLKAKSPVTRPQTAMLSSQLLRWPHRTLPIDC